MAAAYRALAVIEAELAQANAEYLALKASYKAAKGKVHALSGEKWNHPEEIRRRAEEADELLREELGDFLYTELVTKLGVEWIELAEYRVETGHSNIYNEVDSVAIRANGKRFKHECAYGGYKFNAVTSRKWRGKSLEALWEACRAANPGDGIGAVFALVDFALNHRGIAGVLECANEDDYDDDDDERRREVGYVPYLLADLCAMLKAPEEEEEEPLQKKRRVE
jgi:hypothetical protein